MKRIIAAMPLIILLQVQASQKREFWETKDYRQWSADECKRILENSPWVQRIDTSSAINQNESVEIKYVARLLSAAPMRQATVRLNQIAAHYADMTPEQKMAFDQRAEEFLSASAYRGKVVVSFTYSTNTKLVEPRLEHFWRNYSTMWKKFVTIRGSKGEKVQLANYTHEPGNREFQFVFPREHEGRPVVASEDKDLILECPMAQGGHPEERDSARPQIIRFKLDKMLINGALEY